MTPSCPNCARPVRPGWQFCGHCRHPLQSPTPVLPSPPAPTRPPAPPPEPEPELEPAPARHRLSRTTLVVAGIAVLILAMLAACLFIKVVQKIALMKDATTLPEASLSTPEVSGVGEVPTAQAESSGVQPQPPANVPTAGVPSSLPVLFGSYDMVAAEGGHPTGSLTHPGCLGCSGGYNAELEILKVRIEGEQIFLTLKINVREVWGEPGLFEILAGRGGLPSANLIIDDEVMLETTSSTLPIFISDMGMIIGDLVFEGQIPINDPGSYKIVLQVPSRGFQPLEGWLVSAP